MPHIFLVQLNPLSTSLHFCRDLLVFLLKVYCLQPFYWYISVFFSLYQSLRMLRYKHSKSSTYPIFPFLQMKFKKIVFSHNMSYKGFIAVSHHYSPWVQLLTFNLVGAWLHMPFRWSQASFPSLQVGLGTTYVIKMFSSSLQCFWLTQRNK